MSDFAGDKLMVSKDNSFLLFIIALFSHIINYFVAFYLWAMYGIIAKKE